MEFKYNDGGRAEAGYKGTANDCVTRAIAIVTGIPYQQIYDNINELAENERIGKRKKGVSNARTGVYKQTSKKIINSLGLIWHPTMTIGSGCKVHLKADELPKGKIIVKLSKHLCAVVDGVINDTHDPSRNETRCVYGYWSYNE